jgi:hypothetical protein
LCEEGLIKGIPKGNYTRSIKNKAYALQAIGRLKKGTSTSISPKELSSVLNLGAKKHNFQMEIVLALWNESSIVK